MGTGTTNTTSTRSTTSTKVPSPRVRQSTTRTRTATATSPRARKRCTKNQRRCTRGPSPKDRTPTRTTTRSRPSAATSRKVRNTRTEPLVGPWHDSPMGAGPAPHVLIVGGGGTGGALAHDLALRGLRVTLVERGEFTSGTTGRHHGLLHSGA